MGLQPNNLLPGAGRLLPACVHRAAPSFAGWGDPGPQCGSGRQGKGRRPPAPDSPEEPVPALGLVDKAREGVHGVRPKARGRTGLGRKPEAPADPRARFSLPAPRGSAYPPHGVSLPAPRGRCTWGGATRRLPANTGSCGYQGDTKRAAQVSETSACSLRSSAPGLPGDSPAS